MSKPGTWCRAMVALGAIALLAVPAIPQGKGAALSALARLEPGLWQIRNLEAPGSAPESVCVADPSILMQLQHRNSPCTRVVIADAASSATVHYTCPAHGFGRTSVRVETPRLAQIESQGIVNESPFAFRAEARRVGACGRLAANRPR